MSLRLVFLILIIIKYMNTTDISICGRRRILKSGQSWSLAHVTLMEHLISHIAGSTLFVRCRSVYSTFLSNNITIKWRHIANAFDVYYCIIESRSN